MPQKDAVKITEYSFKVLYNNMFIFCFLFVGMGLYPGESEKGPEEDRNVSI